MATNSIEKFLLGTYDPDLVAILVTRRKKRKTNEETWGESRYVCFDLLFLPSPSGQVDEKYDGLYQQGAKAYYSQVCLTATVTGACGD